MAAIGILGYGAYIPRRRMSRDAIYHAVGWAQPSLRTLASGRRAFAAWDEDAITMGVEAARRALRDLQISPDALCLASTTAPFLDRQNAGVIAAALDLSERIRTFDMAGSQRAAVSALIAACNSATETTIIAAAEKRPVKAASVLEMASADAGAAVVVGCGEPIAEFLGSASVRADFVDHYRTAQSGADYAYEERWVREAGVLPLTSKAIGAVLADTGVGVKAISTLIAPMANFRLARSIAIAAGLSPGAVQDVLTENCGVAGAAHPLLMLSAALDKARAGDLLLLIGFGQGCDAALLRVTAKIAPERALVARMLEGGATETNYLKFLAASGRLDIEWGMRAERDNRTAQTVAFNKSRDIYGFVGGLCTQCQTPQFPKSRRCVNPECAALDKQEDYRFADRNGVIKTFTEDHLAFTREPPLVYGNISFDGGGNVFMEMADFASGEARIGGAVEMRFRIKDVDETRGFHRYFWKAAPAAGGAGG